MVLGGWTETTSLAAAAGITLIGLDVTAVRLPLVAWIV